MSFFVVQISVNGKHFTFIAMFYKNINSLLFIRATIIVKSVGKVAFFTSFFFLPPPAPGPMLSKTLMFARNCSVIFQH